VADVLQALRDACAEVAARARYVRIDESAVPAYAETLGAEEPAAAGPDPETHLIRGSREELAAFWLSLDAINFGSGWFPTLRKPSGKSGYHTIASGLAARGPWSVEELRRIDAGEVALALGQDPGHELMELFAGSLRDLGRRVPEASGFSAVVDQADGSAVQLVEELAGWPCFADASAYGGLRVPFLKRAQIAAADLHRAGVARFADLARLTMFADNLVPHVLRLDGVLRFSDELVARIDRGELIRHGSTEEVEIRACGLQAVELIVAARPGTRAADLDQQLWLRGQGERYKARPRHRSRCTAY
jgi:hypothetical protein